MQAVTATTAGTRKPVFTINTQSPIKDPQGIDASAPRYLFFAGDVVSPRAKRSENFIRWGGETVERDYRTLEGSNFFIPRNAIVPMLSGVRWENEDLVPENPAGVIAVRDLGATNGMTNRQLAFATQPGTELASLLARKSNIGFVELTALRGWTYEQVRQYGIQEHFFPEWNLYLTEQKKMPLQLSWARKQIEDGIARAGDDQILVNVGRDMLRSCDAFYYWGLDRLKDETVKVKSPPNPVTQFTFSYTDLAEQLFEMLEIDRNDYLKATPVPVQPAGVSANIEVVDKLAEMFAQNQQLMAAVLAKIAPEPHQDIKNAPEPFTAQDEGLESRKARRRTAVEVADEVL